MTPITDRGRLEALEATWARLTVRLETCSRFLDRGLWRDAADELAVVTALVDEEALSLSVHLEVLRPSIHDVPVEPDQQEPSNVSIPVAEALNVPVLPATADNAQRTLPCPLCAKQVKVRVTGEMRAHACVQGAPPWPDTARETALSAVEELEPAADEGSPVAHQKGSWADYDAKRRAKGRDRSMPADDDLALTREQIMAIRG